MQGVRPYLGRHQISGQDVVPDEVLQLVVEELALGARLGEGDVPHQHHAALGHAPLAQVHEALPSGGTVSSSLNSSSRSTPRKLFSKSVGKMYSKISFQNILTNCQNFSYIKIIINE